MMNQAKVQNTPGFPTGAPGNVQQNNPDGQNGQLMRSIYELLQEQPTPRGWRTQVGITERVHWVKQIIDSLRLLPHSVNDIPKIVQTAVRFEQKAFNEANEKKTYENECRKKLGEIKDSRTQQANTQAHLAAGQHPFQRTQQMQQMGQNFPFPPQLQHQMQASPIPQPHGQQANMSVNPAINMQAGGGGAGDRGIQQPNNLMQNQPARPNLHPPQINVAQDDNKTINQVAQQLAAATSPEDTQKIHQMLKNMPADQLQNLTAMGVNPMVAYFRKRAKEWLRSQHGLSGNPNFPPNPQMTSALQAPRQGQTPANIPPAQGGRGVPENGPSAGTPFMNSIDHFQGLQREGLSSQARGQLVVPASNGQGINPEQFRLLQGVNHQQLAKQNTGGRVNHQFMPQQPQQPQQPPLGQQPPLAQMQQGQAIQQPQQEKPNNAASFQTQLQARGRAEAAARAQQQQIGMPNPQGLQGANVQAPAQLQPQGTPQPRPPSRAPNPRQQPTPQLQQPFPPAGQPNSDHQSVPQSQLLSALPPWLRDILSKHPQQQWKKIIEQYKQQTIRQPRFQPGAPPMSQTLSHPSQNAPASNGPPLGDGAMNSLPMQPSASAGAPVAQGPNQGMVPTQQMRLQQQQLLQQQHQQQQHQQQQRRQADANRSHPPPMPNPQASLLATQQGNTLPDLPENSIAYMDQQPIPQQVYQNVVQKFGLPSQIKTWAHLKQYLGQNPSDALPMEKILSVQKLQFQQMVQYMQSRNRPSADQSRPLSVQPGPGPQPPSQMPANPQDPSQLGQMAGNAMGNLPPVTREEIQRVRMNNPQLALMSDHQIRAYLTYQRLGPSQQPPSNHPATFVPGQTSAQAPEPGPPRQQPQPTGTIPGGAVVQTPQMRAGVPDTRSRPSSAPRPVSQPVPPPQMAAPNQQSGKGMKRASENEVTDASSKNLAYNAGLQQQAGASQPAPAPRMLSKEEISRLPPEQQKSYRERQNQLQQQMFLGHIARLTEEVRRTSPVLHPRAMDAASRSRIVKVLTAPATKQMLSRFNVFLYQHFLLMKSLDTVKQLLSHKMHLFPQYTPASIRAGTWEPADQFSIDADYAELAVKDLLGHFSQIISRFGPQQPMPNAAPPSDATGSHPLSADNLKKHQELQVAQRAKRPAQEAPPAPTVSQPPFTFTDASPRGQGTPRYAPARLKQGLKQEDLKLPFKRQKKTHPENAVSTPVGGQATPAMSPLTTKSKQPEQLLFKCTVAGCQFQDKGFATKSELDDHSNTAHKPVEEHIADPLAFLLDSVRDGLGLDENGEPKARPKGQQSKAPEMQKTSSRSAGLASKPSTPAPSATMMVRGASQLSGPKDASPNPLQGTGAKGQPSGKDPGSAVTEHQGWDKSIVSLSDLRNTFGDLISEGPRASLNHYDPLGANNNIAAFMDEFMESEAWTKIQETAVHVDTASSKATGSPALHSDRGQGGSDTSKGDEMFIKIDAEDTELAESWALPELKLDSVGGADSADEVDAWMKMDFGEAPEADGEMAGGMDFEWKDVDWDKLLAEEDKAAAAAVAAGKK